MLYYNDIAIFQDLHAGRPDSIFSSRMMIHNNLTSIPDDAFAESPLESLWVKNSYWPVTIKTIDEHFDASGREHFIFVIDPYHLY